METFMLSRLRKTAIVCFLSYRDSRFIYDMRVERDNFRKEE